MLQVLLSRFRKWLFFIFIWSSVMAYYTKIVCNCKHFTTAINIYFFILKLMFQFQAYILYKKKTILFELIIMIRWIPISCSPLSNWSWSCLSLCCSHTNSISMVNSVKNRKDQWDYQTICCKVTVSYMATFEHVISAPSIKETPAIGQWANV